MPRIRTIKPEFWSDEKLAPLDAKTRLVFLGLISMADDTGRVVDSIKAIDGFIFPETEDTAVDSLDRLTELKRIDRGITASGQAIIQIGHWTHQKIDKPNMAAALPPIAIYSAASTRRRSIPPRLWQAIYERDGGLCQICAKPVQLRITRYPETDDAEVDHIVPVVDGGTNDPQNLRLLCLACNRQRAGEASVERRRKIAEPSTPHINDQDHVPTTNDQRSASVAAAPDESPIKLGALATIAKETTQEQYADVLKFLYSRKEHSREAWTREMAKLIVGTPYTGADLAGACADCMALEAPIGGPHALRAFVAKQREERLKGSPSSGAGPARQTFDERRIAEAKEKRELDRRAQLDRQYEREREAALNGFQPTPEQFRQIEAKVAAVGNATGQFAELARNSIRTTELARLAGFPDQDEWIASRLKQRVS